MATDIEILIKATDKASGPLKNVAGAVDNLGKRASATKGSLGVLGVALGTVLGNVATAGIGRLVSLGSAVVSTGVNFNNLKQQADIAFTTMLGSGEKAKVFLDDLQEFAAATPFEFPELLQASQRLLAMGFAAEDVKPTLTAIGDAVAALGGSGELVGRVTTALGQMQAKGKASAEEMAQLTEAGIPGWKFLAEAIGTDVAGAMEAVSKGAVDAKTVIGAVTEGMNRDFGGMMAKQSTTFGGLLSTLKDTFTQVSGTVMQPLFGLITSGLAKIVEWTSKPEFEEGVKQFAANVETFATNAITKLTEIAQALTGTFNTIQGTVINTIGWIRLAWDADWGNIRTTWEKFAADMPAQHAAFWAEWHRTFGTESQQNVNDWEWFFGESFEKITSFWRLAVANYTQGLKMMHGIQTAVTGLMSGDWGEVWDGMKEVVFSFTDVVLNLFEYVFGPRVRNAIAQALQYVWRGFEKMAQAWNTVFGGIPGAGKLEIPDWGDFFPEPSQPSLAPNNAGASTSSVTTNITSPINVNFYGPADQQTVATAGRTVRNELRLLGAV